MSGYDYLHSFVFITWVQLINHDYRRKLDFLQRCALLVNYIFLTGFNCNDSKQSPRLRKESLIFNQQHNH